MKRKLKEYQYVNDKVISIKVGHAKWRFAFALSPGFVINSTFPKYGITIRCEKNKTHHNIISVRSWTWTLLLFAKYILEGWWALHFKIFKNYSIYVLRNVDRNNQWTKIRLKFLFKLHYPNFLIKLCYGTFIMFLIPF